MAPADEVVSRLRDMGAAQEVFVFSVKQKRDISEKVQVILRETGHPELPDGEIQFLLHVVGAESWSWADIRNNGAVTVPDVNPWNERQAAGPDV